MSPKPDTRSIERTVEIDAPADAVWKALTDAQELANWFPLEARVTPGEGGSIWMRFTDEMQFDSPIGAWEPGRRLQLVHCEPNEQVPHRVAVDYHLESDAGRTLLRLVHSGFSTDAVWDAMYDATDRGWACMLPALKHYLERHRGRNRDPIFLKQPLGDTTVEEAWARLFGPHALAARGSIDGLAPGDRVSLQTADADEFEGVVRRIAPPMDFEATLENLNDGLIRVQVDELFGNRDAYINLWLWGVDEREVQRLRRRLAALISTLFNSEEATSRP